MSSDVGQNVPSWVSLDGDEQLLWIGHPSWWTVGWWVLLGVIITAIGIGGTVFLTAMASIVAAPLTFAPLVLVVAGVLLIVAGYIKRQSVMYAVTDNEVYEKTGMISNNFTQIPMSRVQNIEMNLSGAERLLHYGDVTVRTAGTDSPNIYLADIPNPREVHDTLSGRLDTSNGGV